MEGRLGVNAFDGSASDEWCEGSRSTGISSDR